MTNTHRPIDDHASSRYMCVTLGLIDELQRDYFAGRDLGQSIPDIDATEAAVIVAESLEADELWDTLPQRLLQDSPVEPPVEPLSDWSRATVAELFFAIVDQARKQGNEEMERDWWALAWSMLDELVESPTASPLLWYEDIYFDVGHELRIRREPRALDLFKRALAHNLHYDEGNNADSLLLDLSETYLWLDELDTGLRILISMLRNDPADIWTYNLMATMFDEFGLAELGTLATRRGLELVESTGDPEDLRRQLLDSLERMKRSRRRGREAEVDPSVLAELRAALALDFDAGDRRPVVELCRELVPDLDQALVKRPRPKPDLPPPGDLTRPEPASPR